MSARRDHHDGPAYQPLFDRLESAQRILVALMSICFVFPLAGTARRCPYVDRIENTHLIRQVSSEIEAFRDEVVRQRPHPARNGYRQRTYSFRQLRGRKSVNSLNKGVRKAEVALRWDPSPLGESPHDLDLVAATYSAEAPFGEPAYVVHFDSRSPDGTIILARESRTGQGFGADEVMTLEFDRLAARYGRVVVGVVIQQGDGRTVFGDVVNASVRVLEGHREIGRHDFTAVPDATAATIGEFVRGEAGGWTFSGRLLGFDGDPQTYLTVMGDPAR